MYSGAKSAPFDQVIVSNSSSTFSVEKIDLSCEGSTAWKAVASASRLEVDLSTDRKAVVAGSLSAVSNRYIFGYDLVRRIAAAGGKQPRAHGRRPQKDLDRRLYSFKNFRDVFPIVFCISLETDIYGGTDTDKCIRSLETCPWTISTSKVLHISRIKSRTRTATSPYKIGLRYFAVQTK